MKSLFKIFIVFLAFTTTPALAQVWPNNAKSAVSISADDGWYSQLTQANILEQYGYRGTFYLTAGGMPVVSQHIPEWRSVFQRGHEVGNHSYSHWSDLSRLTWTTIANDVGAMEWWLLVNIYSMTYTDHTYAYPYGNYIIGPQPTIQYAQVGICEYAALLSAAVSGARTAIDATNDPTKMNDPAKIAQRRYFINGTSIYGPDALNKAKAAIDVGIATGSWTNLVFHQLSWDGSDPNAVSESDYIAIMDYLHSKQSLIWVAPVVTVKNYIIANTPSADWNCAFP